VEFASADQLLQAARQARAAGFATAEAYSPFAVDGLAEALGFRSNRIALITAVGGILGGASTYALIWYSAVLDYPINVGGRPLYSWPSFVPPTFEFTILGAALAAAIGMLISNGLPRLRHPLFDMPEFDLASRDRFFLFLPASDPAFDAASARAWLEPISPLRMTEKNP
jgi:hypothetical protein